MIRHRPSRHSAYNGPQMTTLTTSCTGSVTPRRWWGFLSGHAGCTAREPRVWRWTRTLAEVGSRKQPAMA